MSLRIDLRPSLRALAERQGSNQLKRPIHIGGLSVRVARGRFEVDDFSIDGLEPTARPFFTAKRLAIALDWSKAIARKPEFIITSVEMTDWEMLVEKWEGRDNFVRLRRNEPTARPGRADSRRRCATPCYRGQFAYEDHESNWSILAPNIDIKIDNSRGYNGTAAFHGGLVSISTTCRCGPTSPRTSTSTAEISTASTRPLTVPSVMRAAIRLQQLAGDDPCGQVEGAFPADARIFFKDEPWVLSGAGDFGGTFHLVYKGGNDPLAISRRRWRVSTTTGSRRCGSLHWNRKFFDSDQRRLAVLGGDAAFTFGIAPLGEPTSRLADST